MNAPPLEVNWCLPMFNDIDGRTAAPTVQPTVAYHERIACTADDAGVNALLVGAGYAERLEAFLSASLILQRTRNLRALVAVRPGFYSAPVAAKLAATLDQQSGGRCLLNVVTGGVPSDLARYGDRLEHDDRYARTEEFVELLLLLWRSRCPVDYDGRFYSCTRAVLDYGMVGSIADRVYMSGSSVAAQQIAARFADTYLMFGEPSRKVKSQVASMQSLTAACGRRIRYGVRINIIARRSSRDAWDWARAILDAAPEKTREYIAAIARESDSVAQRRMFDLRDTVVPEEPALWTGLGHLRVGAATAVVGSYDEVVEGLLRYRDVGVSTLVLAGFPHAEECAVLGEHLLPRLARVW